MSTYPGIVAFCTKLYEGNIRSPYLLGFMIDYHEEMLERGCEDDEDVLNSALDVSTMLQIVNILSMAPRMVYCNMINLLWSFMSK